MQNCPFAVLCVRASAVWLWCNWCNWCIQCPYNYMIDPIIRSAMSIDLTDAVVVFDEVRIHSIITHREASYK